MTGAGATVTGTGWRHRRPFWGGLFVLLGGLEIMFTVWAPLGVVLHVGMQNFIGYLIPIVIILCGLLLWFTPAQRIFYSLVAIVCGLASWLTSNMGGFIIGLLLTLTGGALAFAWTTGDGAAEERDTEARTAGEQPVGEQPPEDPTIGDLSIVTSPRRADTSTEE
ncbi:DUF6114 domain-containing protein [Actinoplanes xinjiangensis]|uniref:DUF6114 domain-containing protein n=1 Tax=Actinoplanes xinjiangensis TaxID=512350 RepID=UPI00341BE496